MGSAAATEILQAGSLPLGLDLEQSIYKVIQPNRCINPTI